MHHEDRSGLFISAALARPGSGRVAARNGTRALGDCPRVRIRGSGGRKRGCAIALPGRDTLQWWGSRRHDLTVVRGFGGAGRRGICAGGYPDKK